MRFGFYNFRFTLSKKWEKNYKNKKNVKTTLTYLIRHTNNSNVFGAIHLKTSIYQI